MVRVRDFDRWCRRCLIIGMRSERGSKPEKEGVRDKADEDRNWKRDCTENDGYSPLG